MTDTPYVLFMITLITLACILLHVQYFCCAATLNHPSSHQTWLDPQTWLPCLTALYTGNDVQAVALAPCTCIASHPCTPLHTCIASSALQRPSTFTVY